MLNYSSCFCTPKRIGNRYFTLIGSPLAVAGIHFGINLTIRKASVSQSGVSERIISKSDNSPIEDITNCGLKDKI